MFPKIVVHNIFNGLITRKVPSLGQGCQFGTRRKKCFNLVPKLF